MNQIDDLQRVQLPISSLEVFLNRLRVLDFGLSVQDTIRTSISYIHVDRDPKDIR